MSHSQLEYAKERIKQLREEARLYHLSKQVAQKTERPHSIWEVPGFPKLFASYSISIIGQWFDMVAIMIVFGYIWNADPFLIALIPVAYAAPQALFSQFAGVIAERTNKIKLMAIADLCTVLLTIGLFFTSTPIAALLILTLRGIVNVIHFPAQQSLIRQLVPDKLRLKAVTWNGGINQAAKIFAPLVGGALLTFMNPQSLLLINAFAFFISACLLLSMFRLNNTTLKEDFQSTDSDQPSFFEQWRNGWQSIFTTQVLALTISLSLLGISIIQLVDSQFAVLFRELAPAKPQIVGWIISSIGAGAITVMMILNRLDELKRIGLWLSLALLFIGISFSGIGLLQINFPLFSPLLFGFIGGIGTGIAMVVSNFVIQTIPKPCDVSTVAGIFQTLTSFSVFLAPLLGAALIHAVGIQAVFILCGFLLIVVGFLPMIWLRRRSSISRKAEMKHSA
ncbi:MFS transporter [Shouchella patagoniensis]|uniref:MFS transporter n=1 Tax=Shouchella patagoniensis TaxID=228576 RepID=UPI000995A8EF|nr:MFS transporter [Shouchella patagoniensis]